MEPIERNLKKIAESMSKENMATSSSTEPEEISRGFIGDPTARSAAGWLIRRDLPVGHPDFGRLEICTCRQREVARSETQRLYRLSNLEAFQGMTFDTFKVQGRLGLGEAQIKSLNFAYNQAQHFAKNLQGWMFFLGPYGCGKTHLAAAIANFAVAVGVPTLFLTVPDLLDWLRFSFGSSDYGLESAWRNPLHPAAGARRPRRRTPPWAAEKLYQIINHRYTHRLSTVLTTNLSLNDIDGRISSRLQDPDLVTQVEISAPDYRSPVNDEGHSPISSLVLLSDRTFGSFSLREYEKLNPEDKQSLQKAFKAATQFSEDPSGWLVLMGGYGSGKTHLAAAIGNYRKALGEEPIFVVVPDLLDHLRAAFNPNSPVSYDRRFEAVRTAPSLILDDLGTQSATPWAREKLYQIPMSATTPTCQP